MEEALISIPSSIPLDIVSLPVTKGGVLSNIVIIIITAVSTALFTGMATYICNFLLEKRRDENIWIKNCIMEIIKIKHLNKQKNEVYRKEHIATCKGLIQSQKHSSKCHLKGFISNHRKDLLLIALDIVQVLSSSKIFEDTISPQFDRKELQSLFDGIISKLYSSDKSISSLRQSSKLKRLEEYLKNQIKFRENKD